MLGYEEGIVYDADVPQGKLDGVAGDAAPVALEVAVDDELAHAQDPARQVQQDLPDAPAGGALVAVVGQGLGRVLDEGDEQLDVADGVDNVEVAPVDSRVGGGRRLGATAVLGRGRDDGAHEQHAGEAADGDAQDEVAGAIAGVGREGPQRAREEVLRGGEDADDGGVQREDEVVEVGGRVEAVVAGRVLGADDGRVEEGSVGDEVGGEAWGSYQFRSGQLGRGGIGRCDGERRGEAKPAVLCFVTYPGR